MSNKRGKSIDNTYLSIEQAANRGFPHADYIAHCLRWSHVVKFIRGQNNYVDAKVLDIGCGKELPLAKTLYSSRLIVSNYIGVDYNDYSTIDMSPFHTGKFPANAFGSVDFASNQVWFDQAQDGTWCINITGDNGTDYFHMPNIITSFEVMEHIEPDHVRATFRKVRQALEYAEANNKIHGKDPFKPRFFMSTPNWDVVHLADNHVNEMKHEALGFAIEDCGLKIIGEWGTFASQKDYKHQMFADYEGMRVIWDKLSDYYESNYLSTIFAPLYPAEARNCVWELVVADEGYERKYPELTEDSAPWTSSEHWRDILGALENPYDPARTGVGRMETPGNV